MKTFLNNLLTQAHQNSRFVFLCQGLTCAVMTAVLSIAFIFTTNRESYPIMVSTLCGGGAAAALGRMATKQKSLADEAGSTDPVPETTEEVKK